MFFIVIQSGNIPDTPIMPTYLIKRFHHMVVICIVFLRMIVLLQVDLDRIEYIFAKINLSHPTRKRQEKTEPLVEKSRV